MATSPTTISALPAAPDPADRSTFNARAYPWAAALDTFADQVDAAGLVTYNNAGEAAASATNAATQVTLAAAQATNAANSATAAANSAATAGGVLWVSGATYAIGNVVYSPVNLLNYRRSTSGAGTTDPSLDPTNWASATPSPLLVRQVRTSNTILGTVDSTTLIDIASGTFTQTFTAAATLRSGWYCYIRNSGTGDITLDPNGSETIDGLTSFVMYPGEARLVQCDGTAMSSIVLNAFTRTFTSTGTFTKPPGYLAFQGLLWGAGGSGGNGGQYGSATGGGGGACTPFWLVSTALAASEAVTIGAGGAAQFTAYGAGATGGTSSIGSLAYGYGGGGGFAKSSFYRCSGGGGGGSLSAGQTGSDGHSYGGDPSTTSPSNGLSSNAGFGGGGALHGSPGGLSAYGGAGGGSCHDAASSVYPGGRSQHGGGGGGSSGYPSYSGAGGASQYGGAGGAGGGSVAAVAGSAPAGGGGACSLTGPSGAGARGECRIWGVI